LALRKIQGAGLPARELGAGRSIRFVLHEIKVALAVADARRRGVTWAAIGAVLGVTASSACHRFGG
jgi:hypothetical protein